MYGEISRYAFDSDPQDTRVLFQQGRPITDADLNFQAAIPYALHREFVQQLIPWHGTIDVSPDSKRSYRDYYVDGMRCQIPTLINGINPFGGEDALPSALNPVDSPEDLKSDTFYIEIFEGSICDLQDPNLVDDSLFKDEQQIITTWRGRVQAQIHKRAAQSLDEQTIYSRDNFLKWVVGSERKPSIKISFNASKLHSTAPQIIRVEVHEREPQLMLKWSHGDGAEVYKACYAKDGCTMNYSGFGEVLDPFGHRSKSVYEIKKGAGLSEDMRPDTKDDIITKTNTNSVGDIVRKWDNYQAPVKNKQNESANASEASICLIDNALWASFPGTGYVTGDYWIIRCFNGNVSVNGGKVNTEETKVVDSAFRWSAAPLFTQNQVSGQIIPYTIRYHLALASTPPVEAGEPVGGITRDGKEEPRDPDRVLFPVTTTMANGFVVNSAADTGERSDTLSVDSRNPASYDSSVGNSQQFSDSFRPTSYVVDEMSSAAAKSWLRPVVSAVISKPRKTALAGGYVALGLFMAQN
ncbi:MAG: hypothetical protein WCH39_23260, partial [Schlesneria sp.]